VSGLIDLSGKHVLVTGASSGLGRHFAGVLAAAGANVSLGARRAEALAETVRTVGPDRAHGLVVDVTVVINNAGVTATRAALDVDEKTWDQVIDTNLKGVWLTAQSAARRMLKNGTGGSIVNIASILGLRVAGGVAPYAVSKAGVVQMTKSLALEWARHKIRVNALAPGYIETELNDAFFTSEAGMALIRRIPQRRLGLAKELDGPLLLLASDASTYMTGSVVAVDGGHLVSSL
jgi:NAD(P)-dependent dehydrogenase (short-subunit alcohol dehydrogenase family)